MISLKKVVPLVLILVGLFLVVAACGTDANNNASELNNSNNVTDGGEEPVDSVADQNTIPDSIPLEMPFREAWESSGHANFGAEAFRHWDEEDPALVPATCAKCHSQFGYLDYIGADGSEAWVVNEDAQLGSTVSCVTCHNDVTTSMTSVTMPSGVEITGLGDESRCMQCHQGRSSAATVDEKVVALSLSEDQVSEELSFINIHYYAATATKYGTVAKGGYEYEGRTYDAFFSHVEGYETCVDCHDSHTLEVKTETCESCHGFTDVESYRDVRMPGSLVDYDGDGDIEEGIYYEIEGLQALLYEAIQLYASDSIAVPIIYDSHAYPYFFNDTDGDGSVSEGEANYGNKYASWTPRMLKAAYNFQVSMKDSGGYAHGGKYLIQLLYDSIEYLNTGIDLSKANRIDHGHFAGSEEAFRHWDEDGAVPASCSTCHSSAGLPLYLTEGVSISQPTTNGFMCSTCHNDLEEWTLYEVEDVVTFPSGAAIASEDPNTNLCMNCHQGRSSSVAVDQYVEGLLRDGVYENLSFRNVHYFPAGATRYGTEVQGGYEYSGKTYVGRFDHVEKADECTDCHDQHALEVEIELCSNCHEVESIDDLYTIRGDEDEVDWDGDGDNTEGMKMEIDGMSEILYLAMQDYAAAQGVPIIYDSHTYPYFFVDPNGNGISDPGEANYGNQYNNWTPRLLQAAYNYQYAQKDPGAFAHNGRYVLQFLYDSIRDIGGNVNSLTRP